MSSKTGNRHAAPPAPPPGRKGRRAAPVPEENGAPRPFDDRFHKMFCNVMIPVLGIMSAISLFAQLTGAPKDDLASWAELIYNSVTIGCCIVAFPGLRSEKLRGWQSAMVLIALNTVYGVYLAVKAIVEASTLQAVLSAATAFCFLMLLLYYKKRKHLFPG